MVWVCADARSDGRRVLRDDLEGGEAALEDDVATELRFLDDVLVERDAAGLVAGDLDAVRREQAQRVHLIRIADRDLLGRVRNAFHHQGREDDDRAERRVVHREETRLHRALETPGRRNRDTILLIQFSVMDAGEETGGGNQ